jgi:hypothetical protein
MEGIRVLARKSRVIIFSGGSYNLIQIDTVSDFFRLKPILMNSTKKTTRRSFIANAGLATAGVTLGTSAISASSYNRIMGANDKVNMGFIGIGNRGSQLLAAFMAQTDVNITAFCDIYEPYLQRDRSIVDPRYIADLGSQVPKMGESFRNKVERYNDFRKLLENKDVDAVAIATPDHWHALQMIAAVKAGKDV